MQRRLRTHAQVLGRSKAHPPLDREGICQLAPKDCLTGRGVAATRLGASRRILARPPGTLARIERPLGGPWTKRRAVRGAPSGLLRSGVPSIAGGNTNDYM